MAALWRSHIRCLLLTLKMTSGSCSVSTVAKWLTFQLKCSNHHPALSNQVIISRRNMAAKAQKRSEEERKSRRAAKEETNAAHKQFPYLPSKPTRNVYVTDPGMADEIATAVVENQSDPSTPILETNPGPGWVSRALLKAGAQHMVLAESTKGFMPSLQMLQEEYGDDRIRACYHLDYLSAWRRVGDPDCVSSQFESNLPALFPPRPWTDDAPVSVVGVVGEQKERSFLTHLIHAMGHRQSLFSLGRPEWFLAVSPALYTKLVVVEMKDQRPAVFYSHLAIVLHMLFDIKLCAQLPGWKFTPHFPEKRVLVAKRNKPDVSTSHRYLLRLRPHTNQPLSPTQVPHFFTFLAQLMKKKKLRLIPKMEQFVPGCGPHLIQLDVTMMTLVADLSPQQFLTIFKAMETWPEYQGSPLKQLLASTEEEVAEDQLRDRGHTTATSQQTAAMDREREKERDDAGITLI